MARMPILVEAQKVFLIGLFPLALNTFNLVADESGATLFSRNPLSHHPGRIVSDVAFVPAFQIGYPVTIFVLMKSYNASLHSRQAISLKFPACRPDCADNDYRS